MAKMPDRFTNEYKIISFEKVYEERSEAIHIILRIYDFDFKNEADKKEIQRMIDFLADHIFIRELYQRKNHEK